MRPKNSSEKTYQQARQLRRNMTAAETRLWACLRNHRLSKIHFRRQYAIGKYIVDFCAPYQKLIIEVDGSQHLDRPEDQERSSFLISKGYRIVRFWNNEIMSDIEGVIKSIEFVINEPTVKE